MGTLTRVVSIAGALVVSGCVTPKDFDTGGTIRAVSASAAGLAAPKSVSFVTTRCKVEPASGIVGTKEELVSKRCWDAALKNDEMRRLGFGMAESDYVSCGSAVVTVALAGADEKAATSVADPVSLTCSDGFSALRQLVLSAPCRCALVYVHGYNTTFAFGVKRLAQLSLDLAYEGVPILFSFAAGGRFGDYVNDTEAAELAAPALHDLLLALTRGGADGAPSVDVLAHSMGTRLVLRAIAESEAPSVRHLVLAAPDIDPSAFLRLAKTAILRSKRLTIYTSRFDIAMSASAATHGGYSRVGGGLTASIAHELAGAEIIDATARATDPYAHSYFAESKVMIDDLRAVLAGTPAAKRNRLICDPKLQPVTACIMPCPEGAKCGPSIYARAMHWLFD